MSNKKVVITCNQGFIGVWTTALFLSLGWKVYGIDNRSSSGDRLFDDVNLQDSLEMQSDIDISSVVDVEAFLQECQPSLIINLAGQAIVPRAFREPFATFMLFNLFLRKEIKRRIYIPSFCRDRGRLSRGVRA
jgi:CDP-glucose 4,6-dehydratase